MKKQLSPQAYNICWNKGTEAPFSGKYNKHFEPGTYVCVNCEAPLFLSKHKFDSGTGWPSFWDIAHPQAVIEQKDLSHNMIRIEALCCNCGAHLGHVFPDGPKPTGLRYCINSLALVFKPRL